MSNNEKLTPNLLLISNIIEENSLAIGSEWIKVKTVKSVFNARKISTKKFRDGYGIPIIEYFIAVVREEKELGNCPIMSKLVNYLLSKNITPKEVFDICMGFRRTLIAFLLTQKQVLKNPIPFMNEVATIFDANLSGVLDIFTDLYAKAQKKINSANIQKEKLEQTLKIINFINTKIIIVQDGRIILANKPFLEMLNVKDLKHLYLKYSRGFDFLSEINSYESEYKKNISLWIEKVCKSNKPFESEIYNEYVNKKLNYSGRITPLPGGENNQYIITFNNISEHIKNEKTIKDMLTHDELTGFRNYPTFEKFIAKKIESAKKEKSRIFLAIVDIPHLREINENNGIEKGDMVISEVAEDLRFFVDNNTYFARLEGSRFGILLQYPTEQASYNWCVELLHKMKQRDEKKTVAITEVDLTESINKLFLRSYDLIEHINYGSDDNYIMNDFENIIEYKDIPEQKQFIDKFSKIKSLDITLYHMELPIAAKVKILSVDANSVKIVLSSKQIIVSKNDMFVYFKLKYLGNIKANISNIDVDAKVITVDRFRFDKHTPLNRKIFRVKVQDKIKAYIRDANRDFDIEVLDINSECVAIFIDRKRNFDINSLVYLDILLPLSDSLKSFATNAVITRIDKVHKGYKFILLCHLDADNKQLLNRYIAKVQMDIIKDFNI